MSLLFASQVSHGSHAKRGGVPTKSLEFQIREYLKWALTPKPKPVAIPVAARPASNPRGGRS